MPVTRIDKPVNVKPAKKRGTKEKLEEFPFYGALQQHGRDWPEEKRDDSSPVGDNKAGRRHRQGAAARMSEKEWQRAKKKAGLRD